MRLNARQRRCTWLLTRSAVRPSVVAHGVIVGNDDTPLACLAVTQHPQNLLVRLLCDLAAQQSELLRLTLGEICLARISSELADVFVARSAPFRVRHGGV